MISDDKSKTADSTAVEPVSSDSISSRDGLAEQSKAPWWSYIWVCQTALMETRDQF